MPNLSRRAKWSIAFAVVIVAGYGFALFWQSRNRVPSSFADARRQGALIAQNIVDLSNQSTADLEKVNQYDAQGNYVEALDLTASTIAKSKQLRDEAVQLSDQVGEMTKALSGISSFDARQAALEAISSRLALITQLVNYSGDLGSLLDALQAHFNGQSLPRGRIQALVNQINTDVNAINNFNTQANLAMDQFDKLTSK